MSYDLFYLFMMAYKLYFVTESTSAEHGLNHVGVEVPQGWEIVVQRLQVEPRIGQACHQKWVKNMSSNGWVDKLDKWGIKNM